MHGHRMGMGMGMGGHMGFLAKQLNLTDDQKSQMKAIWQKEMKPLFQQQRQIDLQLRQLGEGTFDANAQSQVQTLATQKAQMIVAETRIHNEMYQLLTPDQQTQLKAIEAKHEARRQQHMNQNEPPAPPEQ
jgi:Spy/CpxP family protein refolding chaperone